MDISEIRKANLLKAIELFAKGSQKEFANDVGTSAAYLSQIINGTVGNNGKPAAVGTALARKIEKALNLEHGWMDFDHVKSLYQVVISSDDINASKQTFENILDFDEMGEVEVKYFDQMPIFCGNGAIGEIMESDFKVLKTNFQPLKDRGIRPKDCVVFPSIGNSMDPTIKDKYLVYVDLSRNTVKDGKIFAVCHGGLFKFKRLYNLPLGGVRIVSDNTIEYPEERLTAQEIIDQQFEIIGWAWSWQAMENW